MKIKLDFITNSSSTAFMITNSSKDSKTLVDFVKENPQIIKNFLIEYEWYRDREDYTQENLIKSAKENNITFKPGKSKYCIFGDESGTIIGQVFDYMLRYGGKSKSFEWRLKEYLR